MLILSLLLHGLPGNSADEEGTANRLVRWCCYGSISLQGIGRARMIKVMLKRFATITFWLMHVRLTTHEPSCDPCRYTVYADCWIVDLSRACCVPLAKAIC